MLDMVSVVLGCTGFHQCRWGYRNVSTDRSVVANFKKARIPLDTMWNDIDYAASGDRDFTNDPIRFALTDWRSFVEELHANGQHYVILIDPGVGLSFV
jgi:alpha-glucosidase/alpha-D-xyloside xylohydrolase